MLDNDETELTLNDASHARWHRLADGALEDRPLSVDEGRAILESDDRELLELLAAAYRVRYRWFGNRVGLNFLLNAKSGLCSEDCGYCSQSNVSRADIARYDLLDSDRVLDGARLAAERKAATYCIVLSGRGLSEPDMQWIEQIVPRIKQDHGLRICVSVGLMSFEQSERLKACGVDRVNHNLNTSSRMYPKICTTHAYQDRLDTLDAVRRAELEICSGVIVGMGETDHDIVEMALQLEPFRPESLPINFLLDIPGTPLSNQGRTLDPRYCLKVLCLFRFANPRSEIRIAAGREVHLGSLQPLGLYPANSLFVGDYLTTDGQPPDDDYRMIEALGFEPIVEGSKGSVR